MSAKEEWLGRHESSERISKLYSLLIRAEEIHEEYEEPPTTDLKYLFTVGGMEGTVKGRGPQPYTQIYFEIAREHLRFLKEVLLPFSRKTMETGIEFLAFTTDEGEYAIFEGEENRVTLPMPHGVTSAHTHPGICLFSKPDLETADSLFIRGYVSVAVMNPTCALLLFKSGPYTLEDREALSDLAKRVKKAKDVRELAQAYADFKAGNLQIWSTPLDR